VGGGSHRKSAGSKAPGELLLGGGVERKEQKGDVILEPNQIPEYREGCTEISRELGRETARKKKPLRLGRGQDSAISGGEL